MNKSSIETLHTSFLKFYASPSSPFFLFLSFSFPFFFPLHSLCVYIHDFSLSSSEHQEPQNDIFVFHTLLTVFFSFVTCYRSPFSHNFHFRFFTIASPLIFTLTVSLHSVLNIECLVNKNSPNTLKIISATFSTTIAIHFAHSFIFIFFLYAISLIVSYFTLLSSLKIFLFYSPTLTYPSNKNSLDTLKMISALFPVTIAIHFAPHVLFVFHCTLSPFIFTMKTTLH